MSLPCSCHSPQKTLLLTILFTGFIVAFTQGSPGFKKGFTVDLKRGRSQSSSLIPFPRVGRSVPENAASAAAWDFYGHGRGGLKRSGKYSSLIAFPRVGKRVAAAAADAPHRRDRRLPRRVGKRPQASALEGQAADAHTAWEEAARPEGDYHLMQVPQHPFATEPEELLLSKLWRYLLSLEDEQSHERLERFL